jgi:hypothetical protein
MSGHPSRTLSHFYGRAGHERVPNDKENCIGDLVPPDAGRRDGFGDS